MMTGRVAAAATAAADTCGALVEGRAVAVAAAT